MFTRVGGKHVQGFNTSYDIWVSGNGCSCGGRCVPVGSDTQGPREHQRGHAAHVSSGARLTATGSCCCEPALLMAIFGVRAPHTYIYTCSALGLRRCSSSRRCQGNLATHYQQLATSVDSSCGSRISSGSAQLNPHLISCQTTASRHTAAQRQPGVAGPSTAGL